MSGDAADAAAELFLSAPRGVRGGVTAVLLFRTADLGANGGVKAAFLGDRRVVIVFFAVVFAATTALGVVTSVLRMGDAKGGAETRKAAVAFGVVRMGVVVVVLVVGVSTRCWFCSILLRRSLTRGVVVVVIRAGVE